MLLKKYFVLVLFCLGSICSQAEGIEFFQGSLQDALKKAKSENKLVFVDFMATWCGPCKALATKVFPEKEIGDYFNAHFVCVQVDVDKEKELARKYQIRAMPTLVFMSAEGKDIVRVTGAASANRLLKKAKEATGELPTFDELWASLKKNKKDVGIMQEILHEAPYIIQERRGQGWESRIKKVFQTYMETKPRSEMVNATDFTIIMGYAEMQKNNEYVEFVISHLPDYLKIMPFRRVANPIFSYTMELINKLARENDPDYKKELARVAGDQKIVFDSLKHDKYTPIEFLTILADANNALYGHKDQATYVRLCSDYLEATGDKVMLPEYKSFVTDLFAATKGHLTEEAANQAIVWLNAYLVKGTKDGGQLQPQDLFWYYLTSGDCYAVLADDLKAKEAYTQAYMLSMQSGNPQLQAHVKQKLDALNAKS